MTMAEATTMIQTMQPNNINHWVFHSLLIVIIELDLFISDSQALLQCCQPFCY